MGGETLQNTLLQPIPHMKMNLKEEEEENGAKTLVWAHVSWLDKGGTAKKEVFDAPHKDCSTVAESHKM